MSQISLNQKEQFLKFHSEEAGHMAEAAQSRWLPIAMNYVLAGMKAEHQAGAREGFNSLLNIGLLDSPPIQFPSKQLQTYDSPTGKPPEDKK